MSPAQMKDRAIELSGDTRIALPIYTLITLACFLLGIRYFNEGNDSGITNLQESFDAFIMLHSSKVQGLEVGAATTNARVNSLEDDVGEMKQGIRLLEGYHIENRRSYGPFQESP